MAAIVLFCLALMACLVLRANILYALLAGLVIFTLHGRQQGFSWKELGKMIGAGVKTSASVLLVFPLIGMLTALWRACGTLPFIICCAVDLIRPQILLLMTFLLNCGVSMLTGTAFGTAATMGTICVSVGMSMGMDPVLLGGAMLSGVFFGDRCSPASSSASLVAAATGTKLEENLRAMHRTGWLPLLLSAAVYAVLSAAHPIAAVDGAMLGELAQAFDLSLWTVLPALLILVLPLCRVPVRWSMAASVAAAFLVTVAQQRMPALQALRAALLGYAGPEGALREILSGGGVISMFTASVLAIATGLYAGLLSGIGALDGIREMVERAVRRAGLYPTCAGVCLLCAMMFCNQSTAPVVAPQLMAHSYEARGEGKRALALDIENSGIVLAALIPWNISVSIPLAMLGAGASALPYAVLLYIIPLCYLVTRRRLGPRAEKEKI